MSKLGELLAWQLNRVFPPLAIHKGLENAKRSIEANQQWAYQEIQRVVFAFEPFWNLQGKHVLDIGTGLGGKLPFYIEAGAKSVTGFDIDPFSLNSAHRLVTERGLAQQVRLALSDAASLPFPDDCFDAIVSMNVFEHIKQIESAIKEAYRVLIPGGLAFLHLPPYYSPWGPHLENWIHFPWPHLLFSDKTLMRVAARQDTLQRLNGQFIEAARIDWEASGDRIPYVNHVTLRQFLRYVKQTGFTICQLRLLPVGYDYFEASSSEIKRVFLWLLKQSVEFPLLREVMVTKMAYVLQKRI